MIIEGGRVVTREAVHEDESILIQDGRIIQVSRELDAPEELPRIDASGLLVLPGFIDLHSDAIEKEIQPRPGGRIPVDVALVELDKRLASCGVTTMYHCLAFSETSNNILRTAPVSREIIDQVNSLHPHLSIHNKIHARFEMLHNTQVALLEELIREKAIHLFSIMDHTPGQGQFTSLDDFKAYYNSVSKVTDEEIEAVLKERMEAGKNFDDTHIRHLTKLCLDYGIPMASHDDDTPEKVRWAHEMGIQISEFPVRLEAAKSAMELGMHVLMGAPNILRGKSLTSNLSGREAIQHGYCDVIGSDHSPSNILHAVFMLQRLQMGALPELVNMVSYHPAKAVDMEEQTGSIAPGLAADIILVDDSGIVPRIMKTFVNGKQVFSAQ
jgi:alpha-D-ribose 1-methylphosphonate 5-triphosphate diphosphatase